MFFAAKDGLHGQELWTSNGSRSGTVLVKDIQPCSTQYGPSQLTQREKGAVLRRRATAPTARSCGSRMARGRAPSWSRTSTPPQPVTTRQTNDGRTTEVGYHYSTAFPRVLEEAGCSLLVSTYQAGQLVAVGVADGELALSFRGFDRVMGVAVGADRLAVAGKGQIWSLRGPLRARRRRSSPLAASTGAGCHAPRSSPARSSATRSPGGPRTAASRTCGSSTPSSPAWPASTPLQLRAALAAAVRLRAGPAGPLSPERPGDARRVPGLRHRDGAHRRTGWVAQGPQRQRRRARRGLG